MNGRFKYCKDCGEIIVDFWDPTTNLKAAYPMKYCRKCAGKRKRAAQALYSRGYRRSIRAERRAAKRRATALTIRNNALERENEYLRERCAVLEGLA